MIAEVLTAVGAGKAAMDSAKAVMKLASEYDKIDLKLKAVELAQQVTELAQENITLQTEVSSLKQKLRLKETMTFRDNSYWIKDGDKPEEGPICSQCFDGSGLIVRLHNLGSYHACPKCQNRNDYTPAPMPDVQPRTDRNRRPWIDW